MNGTSHRIGEFTRGLAAGAVLAAAAGLGLLYLMSMEQVIAVSVPGLPGIHRALAWTYDNLRLSLIPFGLTLALYAAALRRLKRLLQEGPGSLAQVSQAEHLTDTFINIFFGIGVIWTAIGMRSALLQGLNGLDAAAAAREGAFAILKRLVDGGILLALSTTIVGGIGGYVMRLVKALVVGPRLRAYYGWLADEEAREVRTLLRQMNLQLSQIRKGEGEGRGTPLAT